MTTHVQIDELNRTTNEDRRARLFLRFSTLVDSIVPTESIILGVSRWGHGKWNDGILYNKLKSDLDSFNDGKGNNTKDALIVEVAIVNCYELFTADSDLAEVARKHGCRVGISPFDCEKSIIWHNISENFHQT